MIVHAGTFDRLAVQVWEKDYTHSQSQEKNRVKEAEDTLF